MKPPLTNPPPPTHAVKPCLIVYWASAASHIGLSWFKMLEGGLSGWGGRGLGAWRGCGGQTAAVYSNHGNLCLSLSKWRRMSRAVNSNLSSFILCLPHKLPQICIWQFVLHVYQTWPPPPPTPPPLCWIHPQYSSVPDTYWSLKWAVLKIEI